MNSNFWKIPNRKKAPEMCLAAIKERGDALKFVPDNFKTKKLCIVAIEKSIELEPS